MVERKHNRLHLLNADSDGRRLMMAVLAVLLAFSLWITLPVQSLAGEDSTGETGEGKDESGAPDPVQVVYAIGLKEIEDLQENVTEENATLYTDEPGVLALVSEYEEGLADVMPYIRVWSVNAEETSPEDLYRDIIVAVSSVRNTFGVSSVAASAVIMKMNPDNSYPYGWQLEDDPCYFAEIYSGGRQLAVMVCWFNEDGAIQTMTLPMVGEMSCGMKNIFFMADGWEIRDRTFDVLERLISASSEKTLDDYMQIMLDRVAAHGDTEYLSMVGASDALLEYGKQCKRFSRKPYAVLSWKSAEFGEALMDLVSELMPEEDQSDLPDNNIQELSKQYALSLLGGTMLNGMLGSEPLAAGSLTAASYSASGLDEEDCYRWYFFKNTDGSTIVCAVSAVRNGNGCYDFSAGPIYFSSITEQILNLVQNGGYEDMPSESNEEAMMLLLIRYAEEIEP